MYSVNIFFMSAKTPKDLKKFLGFWKFLFEILDIIKEMHRFNLTFNNG